MGESLNNMFVRLAGKDKGAGIRFVDSLKPAQKKALSIYWKATGQDELRLMFFRSLNE